MCPPWLIWPGLWGWAPKVGPATESPGAWFAQAAQGVAGHHQHLTFPSQEGDRSLASYPPLSQTFCETWGRPAPPPQAPPPPLPSSDCPLPHSRPGRALGQAPVGTVPQKPSADQGGWAHRDSGCTVWARAGGTQRQRAVKALGMAGARLLCWGGAGGKGIGSQGHSAGSLGGVPSDPPGQRRPRAPDKDLLHSAFLLHPWIFL